MLQKPTCYELIRCQIVPMPSPEIISGLEFMLHPIMQLQIPSQLTPRASTLSFQWLCVQGRCWHITPHHAHPAWISCSKYQNLWVVMVICLNFMAPSSCHGNVSSLQNCLGFGYMTNGLLVQLFPHTDKPAAVHTITSPATLVNLHLHQGKYFPDIVVQF